MRNLDVNVAIAVMELVKKMGKYQCPKAILRSISFSGRPTPAWKHACPLETTGRGGISMDEKPAQIPYEGIPSQVRILIAVKYRYTEEVRRPVHKFLGFVEGMYNIRLERKLLLIIFLQARNQIIWAET